MFYFYGARIRRRSRYAYVAEDEGGEKGEGSFGT